MTNNSSHNSPRPHPDNHLWVFCCCGCLPPIGAIKALLFFAPAAIYTTLALTATAVLFLPYHAYLICKLTSTTALLGRNLRLLLLLLLPFAILVWLPLVGLSALFGSALGNFFYLASTVFKKDLVLLTGGVEKCYRYNHGVVKDFWEICAEKTIVLVDEFGCVPRGWEGRVYEIPFFKVVMGVILAVYGMIVGPLLLMPIAALKFVPLLIRANVEFWQDRPDWHWIPFWTIGWILMNVLSPLGLVVALLWGLACGVFCPLEVIRSDSIMSGIWQAVRIVRQFDEITNDCIFVGTRTWSCIPAVPPSPYDTNTASNAVTIANESLRQVYGCFLKCCRVVAETAIAQGTIEPEHLLDAEPFVIIGVPALALFDILVATDTKISDKKMKTVQGTIKRSELGQSSNGIVAMFWPRLQLIGRRIKKQKLSATDMEYVRFQLLLGGAGLEDLTNSARERKEALEKTTKLRKRETLNRLVSELNSISIDLSRLKFMLERFQPEVLLEAAVSLSNTEKGGREIVDPAFCTTEEKETVDPGNNSLVKLLQCLFLCG